MTEKILPFPEGEDWFVWRNQRGELTQLFKGRYAIVGAKDGVHRTEYLNPDLGDREDAVVEYLEDQKVETRQINSRRDYEELLAHCEVLNSPKREG